jgi:dipeptidyl aminopeptidase/acylaminoacyl peptidase
MVSFRSLLAGQFVAVAIILSTTATNAADKRPMQVEDLFKFKRVAAPQISPDGKSVVYSLTTVSLADNKSTTALWIAGTGEKTPPKPLTDPKGKKDNNPRWSPDGTHAAHPR